MIFYRVIYLEPYFDNRISYFKDLSVLKNNFSMTIDVAYEDSGKDYDDFYNDDNIIQNINEYSDRINVEVVEYV